jgi:integrase
VRLLTPRALATCRCVQPFARRSSRMRWPKGTHSRLMGCNCGWGFGWACCGGRYPVCQELSIGGVAGSLIGTDPEPAVVGSLLGRRSCHGRTGCLIGLLLKLQRRAAVVRSHASSAVRGCPGWGVLESAPKLALLPGERHRERVITPDEEMRYLAVASPLLADAATILADTGMRPDECYRLRWEDVTWVNGRNGSLLITHGKTAAARRVLPMTPRVRATLEARWNRAGRPLEGWLWPALTARGHVDHSSLKKQHARTFRTVNADAKKNELAPVKPFVLYSFRHTFLTRLGRSGCDAWTLARIAGHSSIAISSRYVHPSEDTVLAAFSRLGTILGTVSCRRPLKRMEGSC